MQKVWKNRKLIFGFRHSISHMYFGKYFPVCFPTLFRGREGLKIFKNICLLERGVSILLKTNTRPFPYVEYIFFFGLILPGDQGAAKSSPINLGFSSPNSACIKAHSCMCFSHTHIFREKLRVFIFKLWGGNEWDFSGNTHLCFPNRSRQIPTLFFTGEKKSLRRRKWEKKEGDSTF